MHRHLRIAPLVSICAMLCATAANAHPLGNFTINHLSKIAVRHGTVDVRYVLDLAEIPTFSAMRESTSDGRMNAAQLAAWAAAQSARLSPQLVLRAGDAPVALAPLDAHAVTRPGAGGLPTLYLVADFRGRIPSGTSTLAYEDKTYGGRLGWRDVVVAPASEPTHELRAYPSALLASPRATTAVTIRMEPDGTVAGVQPTVNDAETQPAAAPSALRSNQLSDMLARGTHDPWLVVLTLLIALGLGALHALEPGHGKTLLAVSLVGARATVSQAGILAAALTVAHTIGVIGLGLAIELFKGAFVPETIYPWITLLSGIAIAIIGARAVQRQLLLRRPFAHVHVHAHAGAHAHEHDHAHGADGHTHDSLVHDHDDEEHARAHAIPGTAPLGFGATVWAAMSGGIAPCPAALVVLLAAIALDQVAYGLVVIVAFSVGLALTLTGLGIGVVRGAAWLSGRPAFDRFVRYGPLVSALVIATIGSIMVGQGFVEQGVHVSALLVTLVTALAIAGYAFSHPFAHRHAVNA